MLKVDALKKMYYQYKGDSLKSSNDTLRLIAKSKADVIKEILEKLFMLPIQGQRPLATMFKKEGIVMTIKYKRDFLKLKKASKYNTLWKCKKCSRLKPIYVDIQWECNLRRNCYVKLLSN